MPAPDINTLENAANASFWTSSATAWGMTQMQAADGTPLQVATTNGCTAAAFIDPSGNVIISFEGTETVQQSATDAELMGGLPSGQIPGFQDALAFTRTVEQAAAAEGIPASNIYITGHSLGGALAEYAASQTGLPGASFAGAGLPGYTAPATPAANFISYIEHGDAFANWSSDGSESVLVAAGTTQDHYGQVVMLGSPSQDALTDTIIADYQALTPAFFTGQLPQAIAKLSTDFDDNLMGIHGMNVYAASIAALPPPSFASAVASISADASALLSGFTHPVVRPVHAPALTITAAASSLEHFLSAIAGPHHTLHLPKT